MLGWFRDEIARASSSKAGVELLESGFNGDGTASRVSTPLAAWGFCNELLMREAGERLVLLRVSGRPI